MTSTLADRAAALLLDAARGERLADLPSELAPRSIMDAYAIQDATLRDNSRLGGWKVAPAKAGEEPRCSPIFQSRTLGNGDQLPKAQFRAPEVEVEIGFLLGRDLPARSTPYSQDEVVAAIASVHAAFEILDSRFLDRKAVSPFSALADAQSNGAMVQGEGIEAWGELEFAELGLELFADGRSCAAKTGGATTGAVLDAVVWLANHAAARNHPLEKGQLIITGSRLGPLPVPECRLLTARVDRIGTVTLNLGA